ncbi:phospholipase D-like domain-containing protein [Pseudomonas sp. GW6]
MFLTAKNYLESVDGLLKDSKAIDIAVAFWGQGAELLIPQAGKKLRILCNLAMGGTNPKVIRDLRAYSSVEIKALNRLHAKVMIGDQRAIIGSANCSANGLNYEGDELKGWYEAGYRIDDVIQLEHMQAWFDSLWAEALPITESMLNDASRIWSQRSPTRRFKNEGQLLQMPLEDLARRDVLVLFWRDKISAKAEQYFESIKKSAGNPELTAGWGVYEDWFDDLRVGQTIIDVRTGARGGVEVFGLFKIIDQQVIYPEDSDDEMSLHIARKIDSFGGVPEKQLLQGFRASARHYMREHLASGGDATQVLSLPDFYKALQAI